MKGITSEGGPRTVALVLATIILLILVVVVLIKCISWAPALYRKVRSLPKPNVVLLRKRNRSDPPEDSAGV